MTQPIKCQCGALFGIEQDDGSLAIKYRDLFRIVHGSISGPCRKCGAQVGWYEAQRGNWPTSSPNTWYVCNCACTICSTGGCCQSGYRFHYSTTGTTGNKITLSTTESNDA